MRASARFLRIVAPALLEVGAEEGPQVYVGGAAGLLEEARAEELEATMRLLELLERRAAVLELVSEALEPRRPVVHVGPALRRRPAPRRLASSAPRTASARRRSARSG